MRRPPFATTGSVPGTSLFAVRRRLCAILLAAFILVPHAAATAQDDVIYRRNGIIDRGRIVSQDAAGVRMIPNNSRREVLIPADQIERMEVKRTPQQVEGERLFDEKQYQAAAAKLDEALKIETRQWLRVKIASSLVACYVAAGDTLGAVEAFFSASQAADGQISLAAVPLWWLPESPGASSVQHATKLLNSTNPLQQVIGASLLFGTEQSSSAREVLSKLTTFRDERVGQLARTQLWRWDADAATLEDVESWQRQVLKLPADARGGPYFAIATALRRLGQHEDAALAFLWPAWVYRCDPKLSSRATLAAAECLEKAGQAVEAKQLYGEVVARYGPSTEATKAQQRLDATKE